MQASHRAASGVPTNVRGERVRRILGTLLWVLVGLQFLNLLAHPFYGSVWDGAYLQNHWDFNVYSSASRVLAQGGSPYDAAALAREGCDIPYNYSPLYARLTLPLFFGGARAALLGFLLTKGAAVALGTYLLIRGLDVRGLWRPLVGAMVVFGFGSALMVDFAAGNVTTYEFLLVVFGLNAARARSDLGLFVAVAALCLGKPIWGVFAAVPLLLHWDRRAFVSSCLGGLAFVLPLVASFLYDSANTQRYLTQSFAFREHSWNNPCLREFLPRPFEYKGYDTLGSAVWAVCAFALVVWTWRARASFRGELGRGFGAATFLLLPCLLPRFKPYAFALLIPFVILAMVELRPSRKQGAMLVWLVCAPFLVFLTPGIHIAWTTTSPLITNLLAYLPLFSSFGAFVILARVAGERSRARANTLASAN